MDNIVQQTMGLFGPTPQELEATRQATLAKQYQTYGAQGGKAGIGGIVGTAIGQGLARLFGNEDPQLKRATDMAAIQEKVATDLSPEEMANPTIYFPHLVNTLKDAGYTKEAIQFSQLGAQHIKDWNLANLKEKETKTNIALGEANIAEKGVITKKMEQEMKPRVQVLREQRAEALLKGNEELAKNLEVEIRNELFSKITPQNQAEQGVLDDFVKKAGGDFNKGALAFANWNQQREIEKLKEAAKIKSEAKQQPEYKTYDTLEEKLNDVNYGVGKDVKAREQTVARRVTTDAKEVTKGLDNLLKLTNGGMKDISGTTFANVKDNGFLAATGKVFAKPIENKESQMYDAVMYPIVKAMTLYSNPDYRPTESDVINGMKSYKSASGDRHEVQLAKLAELKKNFIAASESFLDNHMLNAPQAKAIKQQIRQVQKAIPFEYEDVINYTKNPSKEKITFEQFLNSKIPQAAIDKLKSDPSLASKFDETFGVGSSKKILGR